MRNPSVGVRPKLSFLFFFSSFGTSLQILQILVGFPRCLPWILNILNCFGSCWSRLRDVSPLAQVLSFFHCLNCLEYGQPGSHDVMSCHSDNEVKNLLRVNLYDNF